MPFNEPPLGWGKTKITEYVETTRSNVIATSQNNVYWFQKLERIDSLYRSAIENLFNSRSMASAFFLLRTHAAYVAAFQMTCAGQISESYSIMRNAIEASLYGLHVYINEDDALTWLNRHDDNDAKKKTRKVFGYSNVLSTLTSRDPKLAGILDILYERTIDFGGHPNAYSVLTNMMIDKGKEIVDFKLLYLNLNAGGEQQGLSMKTLGQVGITCLYVFKHVWKHRFDIIGLSDRIEQEKPDL